MVIMTDSALSLWHAPLATHPVSHTQVVPGSKSITNRAFIIAATATSPSVISGALVSRDTNLMAQALRDLGIEVETSLEDATVTVRPSSSIKATSIDCGLAGTVMRFVPPVAALADGKVLFDGDEQAYIRPMAPLLDGLRQLGVDVEGDQLPFTVTGSGTPRGGVATVDASGSSQFVSGLLLAGTRFSEGVTVKHTGESLPSLPHIEMTLDMLRTAGASVSAGDNEWHVDFGPLPGRNWVIEPDLSNATPFLAAAAVTGGSVSVPHWPSHTTQPGDAIRDILTRMGARVSLLDDTLTVSGNPNGALSGLDIDMGNIGELTPTVAAMAALADSPTQIRGIAHLRGHETDRLAALTAEINKFGGDVEETTDGLIIRPRPLNGGTWHSYADHRMATAGAIIGLRTPNTIVEDVETTSKTLPGFASMWEEMIRG